MEAQTEINTKQEEALKADAKLITSKKPAISYAIASGIALFLMLVAATGAVLYGLLVDGKTKRLQQEAKVAGLMKELSELEGSLKELATEQEKAGMSMKEMTNREAVRQKSQDELLTAAVNRVAPSVVSIVITKDVPKLEVVYQNPFGDDPYFKNFGFQIPVYRQNGTQRQKIGAGTGFIVSTDGYILTNKHVVWDKTADYTVLLPDGKQQSAKVFYLDPENDLAVIKVEGRYNPASLGNSSTLKLGQTVIAIGNALGEYNNSVSVGIISGLDRNITAAGGGMSQTLTGVIQTDAAINPGNSGGPLIDLNGKVVGVNVATVTGSSNISFSIPIDIAKEIVKRAIQK